VSKVFRYFFIFFIISKCSLHDGGGFWTNEKDIRDDTSLFKSILEEKKLELKEFNPKYEIFLEKSKLSINKNSYLDNNDGYTLFNGSLEKKSKFHFSKIKNYQNFDPNLIFYKNRIIFFDNKGTILNFDENSKLIWKKNYYTKDEKKSAPLLSMTQIKDRLVITDNLGKIYVLNINNGEILWSKSNEAIFNSEVKVYDDKIFVVDTNNDLNCYSMISGEKIWMHITEKSFINSSKVLSIIIKDNIVVFNNSIGDIVAVNKDDGSLIWQISTQNSFDYDDIMNLKTSSLVADKDSVYFSNNKNQFFSVDLPSGTINWIQSINSDLKIGIAGKILFTISLDGYFFVIDKESGNILRITNLSDKNNKNKKKSNFPSGFIFNNVSAFISTNDGKLIIMEIKTGNINKVLKIDNGRISRPFAKGQKMYLIRDDSILKLD